ncbi:hypothetical protein K504DRAFT_459772 [Pleomassaria siparia CBS 279.74]|uniref:Uncharacterized protein n=1 Tax=Pleomassaria siparia CBS 279.74 TaxID=1314801 RepID=A0A6G1K0T2_9PLEO|nr:hypothetical protein K504DRAFT_459772 [Pleomassaria siparia CBS 279.74]
MAHTIRTTLWDYTQAHPGYTNKKAPLSASPDSCHLAFDIEVKQRIKRAEAKKARALEKKTAAEPFVADKEPTYGNNIMMTGTLTGPPIRSMASDTTFGLVKPKKDAITDRAGHAHTLKSKRKPEKKYFDLNVKHKKELNLERHATKPTSAHVVLDQLLTSLDEEPPLPGVMPEEEFEKWLEEFDDAEKKRLRACLEKTAAINESLNKLTAAAANPVKKIEEIEKELISEKAAKTSGYVAPAWPSFSVSDDDNRDLYIYSLMNHHHDSRKDSSFGVDRALHGSTPGLEKVAVEATVATLNPESISMSEAEFWAFKPKTLRPYKVQTSELNNPTAKVGAELDDFRRVREMYGLDGVHEYPKPTPMHAFKPKTSTTKAQVPVVASKPKNVIKVEKIHLPMVPSTPKLSTVEAQENEEDKMSDMTLGSTDQSDDEDWDKIEEEEVDMMEWVKIGTS